MIKHIVRQRPVLGIIAVVVGLLLVLAGIQTVATTLRPQHPVPISLPHGAMPDHARAVTSVASQAATLPSLVPQRVDDPVPVAVVGDRPVGQSIAAAINCARAAAGQPPLRVDERLSQQAATMWQRLSTRPDQTLDQVASAYPLRAVIALDLTRPSAPCHVGDFNGADLGGAPQVTSVGIAAFVAQSPADYSGVSALVIGE